MKSIRVVRMLKEATLPTRGHPTDAGLDIYASQDVSYKPGEVIKVPTGIAIEVPAGYVGLVRDRSSVSLTGLKVTAGVVDAGYTGELKIVFLNHSGDHGCIRKGQKVAQMLVIPAATPEVVEVVSFAETERGANGFGSTGV